ncbi:MAG TPA: AAA family ATPase [Terracidiphilus sp.]|nr:AAA family ATPase [Terracidiphilus sp.]
MTTSAAIHEKDRKDIKTEGLTDPSVKPQSIADIDVPAAILEDLALKILYMAGSTSLLELSSKMQISYAITHELFSKLRSELFCQVKAMEANIPQIALTSLGRSRAGDLLSQSHYVGAAPVAFDSYTRQVQKQSVQNVNVNATNVARAFAHLVLDDETLRQLGTALNSGSALFLYGPPGTGKTTIAEALSRVLAEDEIWIPYAVEVAGQIIAVYDPSAHVAISDPKFADHDSRWVRCHRPAVLVGGELTAEMLDLQFNPVTKFYVGPVQMKANNGVLIIDDFGRQRLRPEELLNRWIVPLDRRIDYLTMAGGKKITLPFEMLVVFASNIDPAAMVDPCFLRRIKTKIKIGEVSDEQFCEIFRRVAHNSQVPFDPGIPNVLIDFIRHTLNQELRSCYPRDIVDQVLWAARYEERKPYLNNVALEQAITAYFLKNPMPSASCP